MEKTSTLAVVKIFICFMILSPLFCENANGQTEIFLNNKVDIHKTLKSENIIFIRAKDYLINTYDSRLIGDSIFFNSEIFVDSDGKSELDFLNTYKTTDGYIFSINVKDIQVIHYSKIESRKFYEKYWKHVDRARINLYSSSALVVTGGVLLITGLIIPGAVIISLGVLNYIKYVYDRKITYKTEEYNLTDDWIIVNNNCPQHTI